MATARDIIFFAIILFAIGTGLFIINYATRTVVSSMMGITAINSSEATVTALEGINETTSRFDYIVGGLFVGLILAMIIASWFVAGNPVFQFIYFIVVVIGVVLTTVLSNVWEDISGASVFGSTVTLHPMTNYILLYLPVELAVVGFIGLVVMFAKPNTSGGWE